MSSGGDSCPTKTVTVDIQENGIIRRADTGYLIGRLTDDSGIQSLSVNERVVDTDENGFAIFEYQTVISELTGLDCANASLYDGGTALCEAALMATRITGRNKIIMDSGINLLYRSITSRSDTDKF